MKTIRNCIALFLAGIILLSMAGCAQNSSKNVMNTENSSSVAEEEKDKESSVTEAKAESDQESEQEETSSEEVVEDPNESVENSQEDGSSEATNEISTVGSTGSEEESSAEGTAENAEESRDELSPEVRSSINIVNYLRLLSYRIKSGKGNRLVLEEIYNSFDNLYPSVVDTDTKEQIRNLMDTIFEFRMISEKRDRIEYIYEQAKAQAVMEALPSPRALLDNIGKGKAIDLSQGLQNMNPVVAAIALTVTSTANYASAVSEADLAFIKDGWELDDAESKVLHNSTKDALSYMFSMVEKYKIPGDYALSEEDIKDFIEWTQKPDEELEAKITWLKKNENTYSIFGPYWLEMAQDYYKQKKYKECLDAIDQYQIISTRILRKDIDYARVLPMAIVSAKQVKSNAEYEEVAKAYCKDILDNTEDENWDLRYFAAQTNIELYAMTKKAGYLKNAYDITYENIVNLIDEQKASNVAYLGAFKEIDAPKGSSKRQKEETKKYNKRAKEERETALPPISNALYMNCELLFALADEMNIDESERKSIEKILHTNGERIFLTKAVDDRFWFRDTHVQLDSSSINVTFDGESFSIPALYVSEHSSIVVTVKGESRTIRLDDWAVDEVKRPKKSQDCSEFTVVYKRKAGDKHKFVAGEVVTISITPDPAYPDDHYEFVYNVVESKMAGVLKNVKFERVEN